MTEQEWLACPDPDLEGMWRFLQSNAFLQGNAFRSSFCSRRKLRLAAVACWLYICWRPLDESLSHAVEVAERFADGLATSNELEAARNALGSISSVNDLMFWTGSDLPGMKAVFSRLLQTLPKNPRYPTDFGMGGCNSSFTTGPGMVSSIQAALLHDIFGNPFHPVTLDPAWLTPTVVSLAQGIYDERAFDRLPVLGDALEDAGCTNSDMLNHCRQPVEHVCDGWPGRHARGCWPLGLLLGKQ